MSFAISLQSEVLKTKRSASFWLSILAAAIMPVIFSLAYNLNPKDIMPMLKNDPWNTHFQWGWGILNSFIFPMFVILTCTLIPQIEIKNNTWKQVFASPQSLGNIYFSKFLTIHLLFFFFFLCFIAFMFLCGILTGLLNSGYNFFNKPMDWKMLAKLATKTYISILSISAIQYCLSLRLKNFIAPVGIGLAFLVVALVATEVGWKHIYKVPYAHPLLTQRTFRQAGRPFIENHEWNSILYFLAFVLIGLLDLRFKKEKG